MNRTARLILRGIAYALVMTALADMLHQALPTTFVPPPAEDDI